MEDKKTQQLAKEADTASKFVVRELGETQTTSYFNSSSTKSYSNQVRADSIVVFIEDSESGLNFFEQFFRVCYCKLSIVLVSVGGSSNFRYAYAFRKDKEFDYAIFIYDRGKASRDILTDNNRKDINRGIKNYKKNHPATKVKVFSPLAFESIFLSFKFLLTDYLKNYDITPSIYKTIHQDCIKLLDGDIPELDYTSYAHTYKSLEQLMEGAVEELTHNTMYVVTHKPSKVASCWMENCTSCTHVQCQCNVTDVSDYIGFSEEKLELLCAYSLLGGLTYILDDICGYNFRTRAKIFSKSSSYVNKLMWEV